MWNIIYTYKDLSIDDTMNLTNIISEYENEKQRAFNESYPNKRYNSLKLIYIKNTLMIYFNNREKYCNHYIYNYYTNEWYIDKNPHFG